MLVLICSVQISIEYSASCAEHEHAGRGAGLTPAGPEGDALEEGGSTGRGSTTPAGTIANDQAVILRRPAKMCIRLQ